MGQPKKQRRKYTTPKHMYKEREGEAELVQAYGLKNMKELWKAKSEVARIRGLARKLLAKPNEKTEADMVGRLVGLGLLEKESKLEDVLNLSIENILDRRLQTQIYKRGLTLTIKQARQEIVHGHIAIDGQRMTAPGHLTTLKEVEKLDFYAGSVLANSEHPIRNVVKKMASTEKAESRDVDVKDVKPPSERVQEVPEVKEETKIEAPKDKPVEAKDEAPTEEVKDKPSEVKESPVEASKEEPKEPAPVVEKPDKAPEAEVGTPEVKDKT